MQLGRVVGTVTATIKHPTFAEGTDAGRAARDADGRPDGEPILAFDRLGAGPRRHGAGHQRRPRASGKTGSDHAGPLERDRASRRPRVTNGGQAMRIAEVIGRVTLSRFNPQLKGRAILDRAADAAGRIDRRLAGSR